MRSQRLRDTGIAFLVTGILMLTASAVLGQYGSTGPCAPQPGLLGFEMTPSTCPAAYALGSGILAAIGVPIFVNATWMIPVGATRVPQTNGAQAQPAAARVTLKTYLTASGNGSGFGLQLAF